MFIPSIVNAQALKKGYHGFADLGYCHYISQMDPSTIEVTTSHGYQFNPYLFLGAGVGFDFTGECRYGDIIGHPYNKRESKVDIPIFFNAHVNFTKTTLSPFIDARVGTQINNGGGKYLNLSLGARYSINENMGLSFSLGYVVRDVRVEQLETDYGNKYNGYINRYYYTDSRNGEPFDGLTFKVGVDF